jgi:hypothetical protein
MAAQAPVGGFPRALERVLFVVALALVVLWQDGRCVAPVPTAAEPVARQQPSSAAPSLASPIPVTVAPKCECEASPPSAPRSGAQPPAASAAAAACPPLGLEGSRAFARRFDPALRIPAPPSWPPPTSTKTPASKHATSSRKRVGGQSVFFAPPFDRLRFSALNPLPAILANATSSSSSSATPSSRAREWNALGLFGPSGRPDPPYAFDARTGSCTVTTERADRAVLGPTVALSSTELQPGVAGLSPDPVPPHCMQRIEPLNGFVPLKFPTAAERCAHNVRRFFPWHHRLAAAAIDTAEAERRQSAVRFLADVCPERLLLPPPSAEAGADTGRRRRKVFVDLGARHYSSSVQWFRRSYPGARDFAVHAFDVASKWAFSFQFDDSATFHTAAAVWNDTGFVSFLLERDTFGGVFHRNIFDAPFDLGRLLTVPAVALADVLRLVASPEDFVVVKMDVEGTEWMLLEHLAATGSFPLIDEMFIECHHGEFVPSWPSDHSLADCHRMFNTLRHHGVYVHEWY